MAEEGKRRGLGRGLSALLGEPVVLEQMTGVAANGDAASGTVAGGQGGIRMVQIAQLQPGKYQPRRVFDDEAIQDLVRSIREKGVLQPLLVRESGPGYEIIAGERRWRAAQSAGLHEVPVIIKEFSDVEAAEVALIENLQRQDLSALEEAEGYRRLMDEFARTQDDLAKAVGKSRSHVANMMRLLQLPAPVKTMLEEGALTAGHARALLTAPDPVTLAREVVTKGLNVRQTEKLIERPAKPAKAPGAAKAAPAKDADTAALERDLSNALGMKVSINFNGRGGTLQIAYSTLEQLDDLLSRLNQPSRGTGMPLDPGGPAHDEEDVLELTEEALPEDIEALLNG